jgi:4-diphosphocytidyl-2-C-methyl-D-erythritol kinase
MALAEEGLSTPAVYRELDRMRAAGLAPEAAGSVDRLLTALRQRNPRLLAPELGNDLQAAAVSLRPALAATLAAGQAAGALAGLVSGSGPTCIFLAQDGGHAEAIAKELDRSGTCAAAGCATGPVVGARVQ